MSRSHRLLTTCSYAAVAVALLACSEAKPIPVPASTASATAASRTASRPVTREVELVSGVRPTIDVITEALRKNDLAAARAAYETYNARWNGVEVYVNFRSRALYGDLETDLEAKLADGLSAAKPDLAKLVPVSEALARKYDEALALVQKGPALSPLFDDLATLRIVRADLRIVTAAVAANDLPKARASFARFQTEYPQAQPLIRLRSASAEAEVSAALANLDSGFKAPNATAETIKSLVAALTDRYNFGVNLLNAAARNADLAKQTHTDADVQELAALNTIALSLQKSLAAHTAANYAASGDAAKAAAGANFDAAKAPLAAMAADAALKTALDNYAALAAAAGDATKAQAANKAALEAVAIGQQVIVGQFWTDAKLQAAIVALPKS